MRSAVRFVGVASLVSPGRLPTTGVSALLLDAIDGGEPKAEPGPPKAMPLG